MAKPDAEAQKEKDKEDQAKEARASIIQQQYSSKSAEEEDKPKASDGFFKRAWSSVSNGVENFSQNPVAKMLTVASGKMGFRIFSIVGSSLALAGVTGPLIPVAAPAIVGVSLALVGVGIIADTIQVRNIRLLKKENDMLKKFEHSRLSQNKVLDKHPELKDILKDQLYQPNRDNQKSVNERYQAPGSKKAWVSKAASMASTISNNFDPIISVVNSVGVGSVLAISRTIMTASYTLVTDNNRRVKTGQTRDILEKQIDQSRANSQTPGYNNSLELKSALREQRIQQIALDRLSLEMDKNKLGTGQIQSRFKEIKGEIELTEKAVQKKPFLSKAKSYMKDLRRAHDPFSQYYDMGAGKVKISYIKKTGKLKEMKMADWQAKSKKHAAKIAKAKEKIDPHIHKKANHHGRHAKKEGHVVKGVRTLHKN